MFKFLRYSLVVSFILFFNVPTYPYDFQEGGFYFNILSKNDMTCEITNYNPGSENKYTKYLNIPDKVTYLSRTMTVTRIGDAAFKNYVELKSVKIPNSITEIGRGAFQNCKKLEEINIPSSVKSIGSYCFFGCASYYYYYFKATIDDIASWLNIDFEDEFSNPVYYPGCLFMNGEKITDFAIPEGTTEIKPYTLAFFNGRSGFSGNYEINVTIPETVEKIGNNALWSSYAKIYIESLESWLNMEIGDKANPAQYEIYTNGELLTSLTIPSSITMIKPNALRWYNKLSSVSIHDGITSIGENAFQNCDKVDTYLCDNSLFIDLFPSVSTLEIGNSVNVIDKSLSAFGKMSKIKTYNPVPPTFTVDNPFTENQYFFIDVFVPSSSIDSYNNADVWKNFFSISDFPVETKIDKASYKQKSGRKMNVSGMEFDKNRNGIFILDGRKYYLK